MKFLHHLALWLLAPACLHWAWAMPKRKCEDESSEEWRDWSINLATSNQVPATLAKMNIEKGNKSGAAGHKFKGKKGKKNAARTMRRARKKVSTPNNWPPLYWAKVPLRDPKTNKRIESWYPFLLPHEWLPSLLSSADAAQACKPKAGSKLCHALSHICAMLGLPVEGTIAIGLHGDGVPVLGTIRKASLDFITINVPFCKAFDERVPFTVIQSKYIWEQETKDEIWKVLLWSLACLKKGKYPSVRHDGTKFGPSDSKRTKFTGTFAHKFILGEIRGDWDWYNQWLQAPTYNTSSGMCWICSATHSTFKHMTIEERSCTKTKETFVHNVISMGKKLSSFWGPPEHIPSLLLCPDWLHSCDQGVGADIAGNLLVEVAQKCPGNNFKERLSHLWKDIQKLYVEFQTPYKFQTLNPEGLNKGKKSKGPPTLKGLAAQVRYMVPLLPVLTNKYLDMSVAHNLACHRLARFLAQAYEAMECNDTAALLKAGQKMAQQYVELEKEALEKENSTDFHIMPKLHLFQHLCEMKHPPKDTWCYKDETFGHTVSKLFTRRGGKDNPGHNASEVLDRWTYSNPFPLL